MESVSKLYSEIIYRDIVYVDDIVITGSDNMAYSNT
jgi:orotate phosphoribosyltransferase-like protein